MPIAFQFTDCRASSRRYTNHYLSPYRASFLLSDQSTVTVLRSSSREGCYILFRRSRHSVGIRWGLSGSPVATSRRQMTRYSIAEMAQLLNILSNQIKYLATAEKLPVFANHQISCKCMNHKDFILLICYQLRKHYKYRGFCIIWVPTGLLYSSANGVLDWVPAGCQMGAGLVGTGGMLQPVCNIFLGVMGDMIGWHDMLYHCGPHWATRGAMLGHTAATPHLLPYVYWIGHLVLSSWPDTARLAAGSP